MKEKNKLRILMAMVTVIALVAIIVFLASDCGGGISGSSNSNNSGNTPENIIKSFEGIQVTCSVTSLYRAPGPYSYVGNLVEVSDSNSMQNTSIIDSLWQKYNGNVSVSSQYIYTDANNISAIGYKFSAYAIKTGQMGGGTLSLIVTATTDNGLTYSQTFTDSCPTIFIYPRYQLFAVYDSNGNQISADKDEAGNITNPHGITVTVSSGGSSYTTVTLNDIFFTTTSKSASDNLNILLSPEQLTYFSYADKIVQLYWQSDVSDPGMIMLDYNNYGSVHTITPNQSFQISAIFFGSDNIGADLSPGTYQCQIIIYDPYINITYDYDTYGDLAMFTPTIVPVTLVVQ